VESTERPLTTRDTVLLISDAVGGTVGGRTVMQKLAYFSSIFLSSPFGHRAYYYGPYSSKVDDALSVASIAGELYETADRMSDWNSGPDIVRYTYSLTDAGKQRVGRIKEEAPAQWERVANAVVAVRKAVPDLNQKMLSSAAKTYLIISDSDEQIEEGDIPDLAKGLGWELSPEQVEKTVSILQQLGLVEDTSALSK
jgi:uncharacterized protein YwgA